MKVIKQNINLLTKRIWNPKLYDYSYNFDKAIKHTKKLGLNGLEHFEIKHYQFDVNQKEEIINLILHQVYTIQKMRIEDLALKCYLISNSLRNYLRNNFKINTVITTGNVYVNKLQINYEPYSVLKKRIKRKDYISPIKFHTWLTAENLDIIDLSFAPNMWIDSAFSGKLLNRNDFEKIVWISTTNIDKNGIVYVPKIIGYEYLERINKPLKILNF